MPMIMKTALSYSRTHSNIFHEMLLNMTKAIAYAVGTECKIYSNNPIRYYVTLENIGYPGWCIVTTIAHNIQMGIYTTGSDGTPNLSDGSYIWDAFGVTQSAGANNLPYVPETCVMIYDENKDTVLFDIHPGSTLHGTDLTDGRWVHISWTLFFARDANNEVLCGLGQGHTVALRTVDAKMDFTDLVYTGSKSAPPKKDSLTSDVLHLTKMVNYLSPDYPEMKSAYISVVRPFEVTQGKLYVSEIYANGKKWYRVGNTDSWVDNIDETNPGYMCYYPIEPFVNY